MTETKWTIEPENQAEQTAMEALKGGDYEPMGRILQGYRERLHRMLGVRMGPQIKARVAASDVLQEAFIEATKRLPDYMGANQDDTSANSLTGIPSDTSKAASKPSKVMPLFLWVRSLAGQQLVRAQRHHLGTHLRDAGREQAMHAGGVPGASSMDLAAAIAESGVTPSQAASANEIQGIISEGLDSLDAMDREILMLRHFEKMPNRDISKLLGITEAGASLRHLRALKRLQAILSVRGLTFSGVSPLG